MIFVFLCSPAGSHHTACIVGPAGNSLHRRPRIFASAILGITLADAINIVYSLPPSHIAISHHRIVIEFRLLKLQHVWCHIIPSRRIAAILSDIPDYCCVLFVYDTLEFKINGTMKKLAAAVKEHAQIVSFGKQSERSLCAWITRHFRAHGKSVTDELCQYLIFRTDGLMTTLGGEIDKIAAYQEGEAITRGAIDAVVIPALNAQTFDISDAVVNRDFEKALFKLQELYAMQTDPIAVLGAIGAQLRRLYYARVILSAGGR